MNVSQRVTPPFSPTIAAIVLGVLASFAPFHITWSISEMVNYVTLGGPLWSATVDRFEWTPIFVTTSSYFAFVFSTIFLLLMLSLRIAFGLQILKYYQGTTTRSRTQLVGVMSSFFELVVVQSAFRDLIALAISPESFWASPITRFIIIPLPILFVFGALLLWIRPMPPPELLPLRREPVIIFGIVAAVPLSGIFFIYGNGYLVVLLIAILVGIEFRRN